MVNVKLSHKGRKCKIITELFPDTCARFGSATDTEWRTNETSQRQEMWVEVTYYNFDEKQNESSWFPLKEIEFGK